MRLLSVALAAVSVSTAGSACAVAAPAPGMTTSTLTLKDHRFTPASCTAPAGAKVRIVLINQDMATEEFDSHDLRVEELVTPKGRVTFTVGPLKAGVYSFMGEFHAATAQGTVAVVEQGR